MTEPKKLKLAFAVTEPMEGSGGIVFALSNIAARVRGASEYSDGAIGGMTCRRAPWADHCAETGIVPASLMVDHGWHFECSGCGVRIDSDLQHKYEEEGDEPETTDEAQRYKGWTPDSIVGSQRGAVYCNKPCLDGHLAQQERISAMEARIRAMYRRMLAKKLPGAEIEGKGHVYVTEREHEGRRVFRIEQVRMQFDFPGRRGALATMEYDSAQRWRPGRAPERRFGIFISAVDQDAFNSFRNGLKKAA